ncbi:MAG: hypothetical protein FJ096_06265 [Deltaproteobacteria bacterium]|nr:hypothetical protein [Deltaproteobacteria bacterium]
MVLRKKVSLALAAGVLVAGAACTNEVIYVYGGGGSAGTTASSDGAGETAASGGGAASNGASSNGAATNGVGSTGVGSTGSANASTGSVSPTGPAQSTCEAVCGEVSTCTVTSDAAACVAACEAVSPTCKPQHQAWLACLVANGYHLSFGCPAAAACEPLLWPYLLCQGGCAGGSCGGSPGGSCGCNAACGEAQFDTSCFPTEPGIMACQCKQNGQVVGNCFGPSDPKACDAARSCCASLLFVDG